MSNAAAWFFGRVQSRARLSFKRIELKTRYLANRGNISVDYGCIRLPFTNDDDAQEVYYHLCAKEWYQTEWDLLSQWIRPGETVIDAGANLGFVTTIASKLVGPTGKVLSFEPSPRVFKKLGLTKALNHLDNVEIFNCGCGSEPATMALVAIADSSGCGTLVPSEGNAATPGRREEQVRIEKLDDFVAGRISELDFLKIDTEGYESEVLKGAAALVEKFHPSIYIELSAQYAESSAECVRILKELGYRFDREVDLESEALANVLAFHPSRFPNR